MLDKVSALLNNPLFKQGLKIAAPELVIGVELLTTAGALFSSGRRGPKASDLVADADEALAKQLEILADPKSSAVLQRNTEIRVHTLLGLLTQWSRYK